MAFHLYRSNRTEVLVEALAGVVGRPLRDPFACETIVVQGKGMERWLSMQLAQRLGVWANPAFPFPRHFMHSVFAAVLGAENEVSPAFEPKTMVWSIAELLRQVDDGPRFAPIRNYLAGDEGERKRIELAATIARAFDEYVVYRPEVLRQWSAQADSGWQSVLWRRLGEKHGDRHLVHVAGDFLQAVAGQRVGRDGLPERVSVFGISTLPPLYLQLFDGLARIVDVHFFLLSPTREYWASIPSPREMQRERSRSSDGGEDRHLDEGHPLLASLGRLGREFLQNLLEHTSYQEREDDLYVAPAADSMLHALQDDMLHLRHRGPRREEQLEESAAPLARRSGDDSIRIHSCHGPMREVEVLHDQLLDLFARHPSLEARHVVVLAPSIAAYAPFIEAVFSARREHAIPYRIADRGARSTREAADAFLTLLEVLRGRLPASEVLDLLGFAPIRERFGIAEDDLEQVRTWITQAGVRWAADAEHRQAAGQPPLAANTWRFGLQRLLLGYAMVGEERTLFGEVLPYDDIEGTETALLGNLADFAETLFTARADLAHPRGFDAWREDLGACLERLLQRSESNVYEHLEIQNALAGLAERAAEARFTGEVDLATVAQQVEADLEGTASAHGFLGAGVTFCELVPMRSIPFRVVCLLGMNDADFPRIRRRAGFDLMADDVRPGDRSSRDDDRYLFLEALLSAREYLLITYAGQSITDNSEIPPSVVVNELLDTLDRSFQTEDGVATRQRVLLRHPLQPFSPNYFGRSEDERLFSYVESYCDGARTLEGEHESISPFVRGRLPDETAHDGDGSGVDLDDLARFFANPSRAFLQRRLGIYIGREVVPVADREPLELDSLEKWGVGDQLLRRSLGLEDAAAMQRALRASGALPPGIPGELTYEEISCDATSIATHVRARVGDEAPRRLELDLASAPRITGLLREVWSKGLVHALYSKLAAKYEVDLWIRHLALGALGISRTSYLITRDQTILFRPVAEPLKLLQDLLDLYRLGLEMPLPFFPIASRAYAEACAKGKDAAKALREADKVFRAQPGDNYPGGEGLEASVFQIYRSANPLAPTFRLPGAVTPHATFAEIALRLFTPLLAHREEVP